MRRESIYALLSASASGAGKITDGFIARSDGAYAMLDDAIGKNPIAVAGTLPPELKLATANPSPDEKLARVELDSKSYLYLVVPLFVPQTKSIDSLSEQPTTQTLGHLHLVFSKAPLHELLQRTLVACAMGSMLLGGLGIIVLLTRVPLITRPLNDAAAAMEASVSERQTIRIPLSGFNELQRVGRAFNSLMARLDAYTVELESQVEHRTAELRQALNDVNQAQRYKTALLASHTHGLQMPLFAIQAAARNALREIEYLTADGNQLSESQFAILAASQELLLRIRGILAEARAEGSAHHAVSTENVPLKSLLASIARDATAVAATAGNVLEFSYVGPEMVMTDSKRIYEIASELLLNSCKFTRYGTITFVVAVDPENIIIDVKDTAAIITTGASTSPTTRDLGTGTGVGLSMVRSFVNELSGTMIWQPPCASHGCTVNICIPLQE
jgi:signal transduction histidine kinase